jgi:hypothetical protein
MRRLSPTMATNIIEWERRRGLARLAFGIFPCWSSARLPGIPSLDWEAFLRGMAWSSNEVSRTLSQGYLSLVSEGQGE